MLYLTGNRKGGIVHRSSCRHARDVWPWSEGQSREDVQVAMATYGMAPCKVCKPTLKCGAFKCPDFRVNGKSFCAEHIL